MRCVVSGLALLVGLSSAAYCQNSVPTADGRPVHPGTAILDSMGIFAGVPDPGEQQDAQASIPSTTMIASPNNAQDKRQ